MTLMCFSIQSPTFFMINQTSPLIQCFMLTLDIKIYYHFILREKKKVSIGSLVAQYVLICESNWVLDRHNLTLLIQVIGEYYEQSVAASRIFLRVFLKKHKLYHLIKKEIHILTTTTIKKTRKYIKFLIAFYEFSYFEIDAR